MAERKKKGKRQRRSGLLLKEQEWALVESVRAPSLDGLAVSPQTAGKKGEKSGSKEQ